MAPYRGYGRLAALVCVGCSWVSVLARSTRAPRFHLPPAMCSWPSLARSIECRPGITRVPASAVAWTSTLNDVMDAYVAISEDGGLTFREPVRVQRHPRRQSPRMRNSQPRVSINGAAITMIWPSRRDGSAAIRLARSTDRRPHFPPAANLHAAALTGLRGWQGLAPGLNGGFLAVWLDGRHAAPSTDVTSSSRLSRIVAAARVQDQRAADRDRICGRPPVRWRRYVETHVARDVCFCCKAAIGVGAERARERCMAAHLCGQHARYRDGHIDRSRADVRPGGACQRRQLAVVGLPRRRTALAVSANRRQARFRRSCRRLRQQQTCSC